MHAWPYRNRRSVGLFEQEEREDVLAGSNKEHTNGLIEPIFHCALLIMSLGELGQQKADIVRELMTAAFIQ